MKYFDGFGNIDAGRAAIIALHEYISNRSVALLLRRYPDELRIGSGVAIQIGHYHLVATAAHNIEKLNINQIEVIPAGRIGMPSIPVKHLGSHPLAETEDIDIAWLELEIANFIDPGINFTSINQIGRSRSTHEKEAYFIQGYPSEVVAKPSSASERPFVESDGLLTLFIPSDRRQTSHQPHVDIAVEYPPHDGSLDSKNLPAPPGISGGGFWTAPGFVHDLLWTTDAVKLVGIARGWSRNEKELIATQIDHWLELVAEDFPDVRLLIQDAQTLLLKEFRGHP